MKYLLDTNVLVAMFRGQYGIREAILKAGFPNCAISEITLAELMTGAYKGGYGRQAFCPHPRPKTSRLGETIALKNIITLLLLYLHK